MPHTGARKERANHQNKVVATVTAALQKKDRNDIRRNMRTKGMFQNPAFTPEFADACLALARRYDDRKRSGLVRTSEIERIYDAWISYVNGVPLGDIPLDRRVSGDAKEKIDRQYIELIA
jgi:uncharacterized protein (UPF0305 family)